MREIKVDVCNLKVKVKTCKLDVQVQVKTCKLTGQVSGVYLELVVDDDDGVLVVIDDGRVFIVAFLIVTFLDLCLFPLCPGRPCSGRSARSGFPFFSCPSVVKNVEDGLDDLEVRTFGRRQPYWCCVWLPVGRVNDACQRLD